MRTLGGLRGKAIVVMALFTMIPILAMGITSGMVSRGIIQGKVDSLSQKNMEMLNQILSWNMERLSGAAFTIALNPVVLGAAGAHPDTAAGSEALNRRLYQAIMSAEQTSALDIPFSYIINYRTGASYSTAYYTPHQVGQDMREALMAQPWYPPLAEKNYSVSWSGLSDSLILNMSGTQLYFANNIRNEGQNLGVAVLGVNVSHFEKTLKQFRLTPNSMLFLVESDSGKLICALGNRLDAPPDGALQSAGVGEMAGFWLEGEQYFAQKSTIAAARAARSWTLLSLTPASDLFQEINRIKLLTLLLIALCCLASAVMIAFINRWLIEPITRLRLLMNRVRAGDLQVRADERQHDEFGELNAGFNSMVGSLGENIRVIREHERLKREIEIRVLQAQINPHFIRNTLNAVRWMAEMKKAHGISRALTSFVQLVDYSFERRDMMATLEEEMHYVDEYVFLQRLRYQNRFDYESSIEQGVREARIPKLLLQPVIENAILHGLAEKADYGLLRVSARKTEGGLEIWVEDDGVGIAPERIESVLSGAERSQGKGNSHIALINVQQRIRLNFGEQYGLSIESIPDQGTGVIIRLPLRLEDAREENVDEGRLDR